MRVIQLLPTLSFGDAIGNDTIALKGAIKEMGYNTEIYTENIDKRLPDGIAKKAIKLAAKMSKQLHHSYIGTEHLLLGLGALLEHPFDEFYLF